VTPLRKTEWSVAAGNQLQIMAGDVLLSDVFDLQRVVTRHIRLLPQPLTVTDEVILRALVFEFAIELIQYCHTARGIDPSCHCARTLLPLRQAATTNEAGFCALFLRWTDEFFLRYREAHPPTAVETAARYIRLTPKERWTATRLGPLVRLPARRLERGFVASFGIGVYEYVRLVRVCLAVPLVLANRTTIEAVAADVGYASKKDFYRAVRRTVGVTPARLRREANHVASIAEVDPAAICRHRPFPIMSLR
jgi:AraC-like DNA-binding protein